MPIALPDTGVWYALFDKRDPRYREMARKEAVLDSRDVVLPWPVVYETLRTRFVRNRLALVQFERLLRRAVLLEDAPYREEALDLSLRSSLDRNRPLSLVDCVLRLMLADSSTRIDAFLTFNPGDFVDVCRHKQIELI